MYVCSAWVAWCLGRSPVFLSPPGRRGISQNCGTRRGRASRWGGWSAMQCNVMQYDAMQYNAMQCNAMRRLKRNAAATGRPAWARYTCLHWIYFCLQPFGCFWVVFQGSFLVFWGEHSTIALTIRQINCTLTDTQTLPLGDQRGLVTLACTEFSFATSLGLFLGSFPGVILGFFNEHTAELNHYAFATRQINSK